MKKLKPVNPVKFYLIAGIPFYILLTLKLMSVLSCSWWWITLPVWLPLLLFALAFAAVSFFATFMLWRAGKGKYRKKRETRY